MDSKKITYQKIKNTKYILLDNGLIARLLTPTIKQNKHYYNLMINNKLRQVSVEEIKETLAVK